MITVSDISLSFGGQMLFKDVNLLFTAGNCYGVIGANGAGKSTFLKILCGALEPTTGTVTVQEGLRMSVLKQDHYAYDEYTVQETVIMGNPRLYEVMKQKDALYAKEDFTEEDGNLASELEGEFAELGGWEAESDASKLVQGLGLDESIMYAQMSSLAGNEKVKVLLAQALFGNPDILLLDEPTNHLDLPAIEWLEEFLINFDNTVIVVSHDRYFLNKVCTQTADIDYGKIQLYAGNYDFWYESSQLLIKQMKEANKKKEEKIKELQEFISRFSANASKSKQATSRKRALEKIQLDEIRPSSRKYPYIDFRPNREIGNEVLSVEGLSKTIDGEKILDNLTFTLGREDKVAFVGGNEFAKTILFKILIGEMEPDEGTYKEGLGFYEEERYMFTRSMSDASQIEGLARARFLLEQVSKLEYVPGIGMLYRCGFYAWCVIFAFIYAVVWRKYKMAVMTIPAVTNLLVCMISPVNTCIRYAMPTMCMIPLLVALLWYNENRESGDERLY